MLDYEGDLPEGIMQLGEDVYTIQGKLADSLYDLRAAIALSNANHRYEYLASWWIVGNRLEIDFRIMTTVPKMSWLFLDGDQWHKGDESQHDQVERLRLYDATKTFANEPYVAKNPDCDTYEHMYAYVVKNFGRR